MTCQLYTFPGHALDLAAAREVLRCADATTEQRVMAMTVLNTSHYWQDVDLLRQLREADERKARDVRARQAQAKAAEAEADRRDRALGWAVLAAGVVAVVVIVAYERAVAAFVMGGM
jgi:hypothetical protein